MKTRVKRYNGTSWVDVELDASSVGGYTPAELLNYENITNKPLIPTKTSELTNDSSFTTKTELETLKSEKQDNISDLDDIRSGAQSGATAVQPDELNTYIENYMTENYGNGNVEVF